MTERTTTRLSLFVLGTVILWGQLLFALSPANQRGAIAPELRDYHHTAWTSENGLGAVREVYQAGDGYLWLTASRGIFRFDGVQFQSVDEATNGKVSGQDVDSAFPSAFGGVWFTTRRQGLILWRDNTTTAFADRRCTQGRKPNGMAEDLDGSLWIDASGGLFHLHQGICERTTSETGYPGSYPQSILLDSQGTLWAKVSSGELYFKKHGETQFQKNELGYSRYREESYLHEAPDHSIWIADREGLRRITEGAQRSPVVSRAKVRRADVEFQNFAFAPDGTLWASTDHGIVRFKDVTSQALGVALEPSRGEVYSDKQGLSSNDIWKVTVDREGCIWLATNSGLDRLRLNIFSPLRLDDTRSLQVGIAPGDRDSVWAGSFGAPLTHISSDGHVAVFPKASQVRVLRRDRNGVIWVGGLGDASLWHTEGGSLVTDHYPHDSTEMPAAVAVDKNNDLWVSTFGPNIVHRAKGIWINENAAVGRKAGVLGAMRDDADGNIWFAFSNDLVKWDGKSYQHYSFPDGPLNISVFTLAIRHDHVWLGGGAGITLFRNGAFEKLLWKDPTLPGSVNGIVETADGDLWVNGFSGIARVPAEELRQFFEDPSHKVEAQHFNTLDGLPGLAGERYPEPSLVESEDGKLWFATVKGVALFDPRKVGMPGNRLPPPVVVEALTADGKTYSRGARIELPPHRSNVEISYTALSLSIPERVQFRYKLENIDKTWQNPGTRRLAFYAHLPGGKYRFHVIASNNDGVWNEDGASVEFSIEPAWYETIAFRITCVLAALLGPWWFFRIRVNMIRNQMQARNAERLAERERIARELHDTLLQSLLGVMIQFNAIADRLSPEHSIRQMLLQALQNANVVMQAGRDRVRDLRAKESDDTDLEGSLTALGYQLQALRPTRFTMKVEGGKQPLTPLMYAETLLIGREALTNAFVHSQAEAICVHLSFSRRRLVLAVRDNGCGIDQTTLAAGARKDHWGLPGMKERARKINSTFAIDSAPGQGTKISVSIPARVAYTSRAQKGLLGSIVGLLRIKLENREAEPHQKDSGDAFDR